MVIANKPLNTQALILENAESDIRVLVKKEYIKGTSKPILDQLIHNVIKAAVSRIKIKELRRVAVVSLIDFYRRQYQVISTTSPRIFDVAFYLSLYLTNGTFGSKAVEVLKAEGIRVRAGLVQTSNVYGVPLMKFAKDYLRENVKPVLDRLSSQFPLDPGDITGRNSLRGRAELEVRYDEHQKNIEDLRAKGYRLVIASTHSDCSERCAKWQGRVYSLDGTTGTTDDGRKYVPLEEATDVYYVTKAGKVYKNGLLGFNCRHYLVAYKSGYSFPEPNARQERKQYAITIKQRELERKVRQYKTEALQNKGVDQVKYLKARDLANKYNEEYIKFSKKNNRAYYPSRTEVL